MTPEEIVAEFPQLTVGDVYAALTYYHDNREVLERHNRNAEELVENLRVRYTSKLESRLGKDADDDSVSS